MYLSLFSLCLIYSFHYKYEVYLKKGSHIHIVKTLIPNIETLMTFFSKNGLWVGYLVSLEWMHSFMRWRHTTSTTNNKTIRKQWGITLPRSGYWAEELRNWCLSRWNYTSFSFFVRDVTHFWALAGPNCIIWDHAICLFSMLLWLVVLADKLY